MKKFNLTRAGLLTMLTLLITIPCFAQPTSTGNGSDKPSIRNIDSDRAILINANKDRSNHVNENIYFAIGNPNNWWGSSLKMGITHEGNVYTINGMYSDIGHLHLVADWNNNSTQQDIIFGFNSNKPSNITERMRLRDDGQLEVGKGVGDTYISLDVEEGRMRLGGNKAGTWIEAGANDWFVGRSDGGANLRFFNNGQNKFVFTPGGALGVNTHPDSDYNLHVKGKTYVTTDLKIGRNTFISGSAFLGGALRVNDALLGLNSLKLKATSTSGVNMLINAAGNVGIGTDTPQARLDVNGALKSNSWVANTGGSLSDFAAEEVGMFAKTGGKLAFVAGQDERLSITKEGKIGINNSTPTEQLDVTGKVRATSFVSSAESFPDYVFEPTYQIMPLSEVEAFVKANHHLPNMPSEKEVVAEGLDLPQVVTKSVENIEEIYLHLIEMKKEIEALKAENAALKAQIKK